MAEPRITPRRAVAEFHLQLIQLLETAGVTDTVDLNDVTVNINYRCHRIDIGKLTPDGQHLGEWICAFSIDPTDLPTFGTPVGLPGMTGPTH